MTKKCWSSINARTLAATPTTDTTAQEFSRYMKDGAESKENALALPPGGDVDCPAIDPGPASHPQIRELRLPWPRNLDWPPRRRGRTVVLDGMHKSQVPSSGIGFSAPAGTRAAGSGSGLNPVTATMLASGILGMSWYAILSFA